MLSLYLILIFSLKGEGSILKLVSEITFNEVNWVVTIVCDH